MRVISGTAKSIQLLTLDGDTTRPTTDRIKETLFNMIQFDIPNCTFWICLVVVELLELKL